MITLCLALGIQWEMKQAWSPQLLEPTEHREKGINQVHKEQQVMRDSNKCFEGNKKRGSVQLVWLSD